MVLNYSVRELEFLPREHSSFLRIRNFLFKNCVFHERDKWCTFFWCRIDSNFCAKTVAKVLRRLQNCENLRDDFLYALKQNPRFAAKLCKEISECFYDKSYIEKLFSRFTKPLTDMFEELAKETSESGGFALRNIPFSTRRMYNIFGPKKADLLEPFIKKFPRLVLYKWDLSCFKQGTVVSEAYLKILRREVDVAEKHISSLMSKLQYKMHENVVSALIEGCIPLHIFSASVKRRLGMDLQMAHRFVSKAPDCIVPILNCFSATFSEGKSFAENVGSHRDVFDGILKKYCAAVLARVKEGEIDSLRFSLERLFRGLKEAVKELCFTPSGFKEVIHFGALRKFAISGSVFLENREAIGKLHSFLKRNKLLEKFVFLGLFPLLRPFQHCLGYRRYLWKTAWSERSKIEYVKWILVHSTKKKKQPLSSSKKRKRGPMDAFVEKKIEIID